MTNILESLRFLFSRPLTISGTLALAGFFYLAAIYRFGFDPLFSEKLTERVLLIVLLVTFLSVAFFTVALGSILVSVIARSVIEHGKPAIEVSTLKARIGQTSPTAKAVVGKMIHGNMREIWLMNDFEAGLELRELGILRVDNSFGRAVCYTIDHDAFAKIGNSISFARSLGITRISMTLVNESEAEASASLSHSWMAR